MRDDQSPIRAKLDRVGASFRKAGAAGYINVQLGRGAGTSPCTAYRDPHRALRCRLRPRDGLRGRSRRAGERVVSVWS
jgi:hypothetical protein